MGGTHEFLEDPRNENVLIYVNGEFYPRHEAKVSVYVGRVAPEKNLPFLLRPFGRVHQRLADAYLLVVGYGPEEQHLRDKQILPE